MGADTQIKIMISRFSRRMSLPVRSFSTKLKLELKSGRIGNLELSSQACFDKLLDRCHSVGLVEDTEDDPVTIVTDLNSIDTKKTYQLAYGFDESEVFDEDFEDDEQEDMQERR